MNAILKPIDRVEARMTAHRNGCYEALTDALDAIILDRDFVLDVNEILDRVQKSFETRQESHSDIEPIYANIQLTNDALDALNEIRKLDLENDRFTDRAVKLEHVKIDVARLKVMS